MRAMKISYGERAKRIVFGILSLPHHERTEAQDDCLADYGQKMPVKEFVTKWKTLEKNL